MGTLMKHEFKRWLEYFPRSTIIKSRQAWSKVSSPESGSEQGSLPIRGIKEMAGQHVCVFTYRHAHERSEDTLQESENTFWFVTQDGI